MLALVASVCMGLKWCGDDGKDNDNHCIDKHCHDFGDDCYENFNDYGYDRNRFIWFYYDDFSKQW